MIMADSGRLARRQALYTTRTARALWMPVTILNNNPPPPQLAPLKANFRGYALGLNMSDYRGYKMAEHTGGLPGFVSEVTHGARPAPGRRGVHQRGVGCGVPPITLRVLDYYMGAKFDWLGGVQVGAGAQRLGECGRHEGFGDGAERRLQAVAAAREVRRHLPRCLVRRRRRSPTRTAS